MKPLRRFWHRLIGTFSGAHRDEELAEELETHRQLLIEDYERRGLLQAEAQRAAALKLGNAASTAEQYRDVRGLPSIEGLLRDLRVAVRGLRVRPTFTLTSILTLALAVGANVTIFSLIDRVVLHPLDVPNPSQLVTIALHGEVRRVARQRTSMRWDMVQSLLEMPSLQDAALASDGADAAGRDLELTHGRTAGFRVDVRYVTANYFAVLGLRPAFGRDFVSSDDTPGAPPVTVLAHQLWRTRFGADPSIVGRTIAINGSAVVIIGVAPGSFTGIELGVTPPDLYLPLRTAPLLATHVVMQTDGRGMFANSRGVAASGMTLSPISPVAAVRIIERLRTGSVERLQTEVTAAFQRMTTTRLGGAPPPSGSFPTMAVVPLVETMLPFSSRAELRQFLGLLGGAVVLTLLIGCANLAGLLLARAEERRPELAVRAALGAGRAHLVRAVSVEAVVLAAAGGVLALLVAHWLERSLSAFVLPGNVAVSSLRDWMAPRTMIFALAATALAALVVGMAPAVRAAGGRLALETQRSQGGSVRLGVTRMLVALQVGIAVILVFGAVLFVRTMSNALATDLGFDGRGLLSASLTVSEEGPKLLDAIAAVDAFAERSRNLPGIVNAAVGPLPLIGISTRTDDLARIDGTRSPLDGTTAVGLVYVSPEYFATIGQALVRGREFERSDAPRAPRVAIVNETGARRFWPDRDPLGGRISFDEPAEEFTVVGVVADVKLESLHESGRPLVYLARQQHSSYLAGWTRSAGEAFLILRTNSEAAAVTQALTRAAADVGLPHQGVTPLEQRIGELLMPQRVGRMLLTLLGGLASMLTIVGIYGLVACLVARNRKEIGIRMTLGAGRQEILRTLVNSVVVPIACGVLAGSLVAWYGGRYADRFMYGMTGSDPATLGLAAAAIAGAAVLAALLPAHRALRIDPVAALRAE